MPLVLDVRRIVDTSATIKQKIKLLFPLKNVAIILAIILTVEN